MYGYAHTVHLVISKPKIPYVHRMCRVGQNRIYTPYMTVHLVIFLPKILYTHRIYMVLANPTYVHRVSLILANPTNNAWDHEHRRSHDTQSQNTAGHTIHNHRTQQVSRYTITEHSRSHDQVIQSDNYTCEPNMRCVLPSTPCFDEYTHARFSALYDARYSLLVIVKSRPTKDKSMPCHSVTSRALVHVCKDQSQERAVVCVCEGLSWGKLVQQTLQASINASNSMRMHASFSSFSCVLMSGAYTPSKYGHTSGFASSSTP
jgi:hypothetical protein